MSDARIANGGKEKAKSAITDTAMLANMGIIQIIGRFRYTELIRTIGSVQMAKEGSRQMDKVAVYTGTKNVYPQMYTALKSLLINNDMDRVYLLIETDTFPYPTPDCVKLINVSNQIFFPEGCANSTSRWTYMDLLRCALGYILPPEEECVLWFDVDTIVDADISELFRLDMTGYYFAGVPEFYKSTAFFKYINTGVCLHNLDLLRKLDKEKEMIFFLNVFHFDYPGQDAINLFGQGRIKTIDSEFNMNMCVNQCQTPKIIHFTDMKIPEYTQNWAYKKYERMEL